MSFSELNNFIPTSKQESVQRIFDMYKACIEETHFPLIKKEEIDTTNMQEVFGCEIDPVSINTPIDQPSWMSDRAFEELCSSLRVNVVAHHRKCAEINLWPSLSWGLFSSIDEALWKTYPMLIPEKKIPEIENSIKRIRNEVQILIWQVFAKKVGLSFKESLFAGFQSNLDTLPRHMAKQDCLSCMVNNINDAMIGLVYAALGVYENSEIHFKRFSQILETAPKIFPLGKSSKSQKMIILCN